jgi:hypothetical protein
MAQPVTSGRQGSRALTCRSSSSHPSVIRGWLEPELSGAISSRTLFSSQSARKWDCLDCEDRPRVAPHRIRGVHPPLLPPPLVIIMHAAARRLPSVTVRALQPLPLSRGMLGCPSPRSPIDRPRSCARSRRGIPLGPSCWFSQNFRPEVAVLTNQGVTAVGMPRASSRLQDLASLPKTIGRPSPSAFLPPVTSRPSTRRFA